MAKIKLDVALDEVKKIVYIVEETKPIPVGATKVGDFEHDTVDGDLFGDPKSHVMIHHINDVLYRTKGIQTTHNLAIYMNEAPTP